MFVSGFGQKFYRILNILHSKPQAGISQVTTALDVFASMLLLMNDLATIATNNDQWCLTKKHHMT